MASIVQGRVVFPPDPNKLTRYGNGHFLAETDDPVDGLTSFDAQYGKHRARIYLGKSGDADYEYALTLSRGAPINLVENKGKWNLVVPTGRTSLPAYETETKPDQVVARKEQQAAFILDIREDQVALAMMSLIKDWADFIVLSRAAVLTQLKENELFSGTDEQASDLATSALINATRVWPSVASSYLSSRNDGAVEDVTKMEEQDLFGRFLNSFYSKDPKTIVQKRNALVAASSEIDMNPKDFVAVLKASGLDVPTATANEDSLLNLFSILRFYQTSVEDGNSPDQALSQVTEQFGPDDDLWAGI